MALVTTKEMFKKAYEASKEMLPETGNVASPPVRSRGRDETEGKTTVQPSGSDTALVYVGASMAPEPERTMLP